MEEISHSLNKRLQVPIIIGSGQNIKGIRNQGGQQLLIDSSLILWDGSPIQVEWLLEVNIRDLVTLAHLTQEVEELRIIQTPFQLEGLVLFVDYGGQMLRHMLREGVIVN